MDLTRKMTRTEYNQLSDEEKKERKRLNQIIRSRKYKEENREKEKERNKKYRENHPEKEKERNRKYKEANPEKIKESRKKYYENNIEKSKEYYENNIEKIKEYRQTPTGKKVNTLGNWKHRGLQESDEELDIIYELYLNQEFCYSCDVKLTRDGVCSTQAVLDHDHITHRFRQICCRSCNTRDSWMQYWC